MFDNQLDFSGENKNNYFIFHKENPESELESEYIQHNYIEDLRNYQVEGHINYENLIRNQGEQIFSNQDNQIKKLYAEARNQNNLITMGATGEQLDFLDFIPKKNLNDVIQRETPKPLIFQQENQHNMSSKNHLNKKPKGKKPGTYFSWSNNRLGKGFSNNTKKNQKKQNNNKIFAAGKVNNPNNLNPPPAGKEKTPNLKSNCTSWTHNTSYSLNARGLFDPCLKKNELEHPKKSEIQRMERQEKIKNYDVKFGSKLKKLQMYNNYMDLLEDIENKTAEREFSKKPTKDNTRIEKIRKEILELEQKLPKPLNIGVCANNLDFDFTSHEQMIKSLEEQIEYERNMRANVNMKYLQKMKEVEELKIREMTKSSSTNKPVSKKSREMINRYTKDNYRGKNVHSSKFKRNLNKSVDQIKKSMQITGTIKRMSSADKIKEKMREISPGIEKMIDKTFNGVYKTLVKKNKSLLKKVYSRSNSSSLLNNTYTARPGSRPAIGNKSSHQNNQSHQRRSSYTCNQSHLKSNENQHVTVAEVYNPDHNQNISNSQLSFFNSNRSGNNSNTNKIDYRYYKDDRSQTAFSPLSHMNKNFEFSRDQTTQANKVNESSSNPLPPNYSKFLILNSSPGRSGMNVENKILSEIVSNQNLQKFEKMNKFEMISNLNKEIENYNKGLPHLIEKVESTIEKINSPNLIELNEKAHPLIKMASKSAGQLIHLHIDEISLSLIDDLLIECVRELNEIESKQKKKEEQENFKNVIQEYYEKFDGLKNLEIEMKNKLENKNYIKYAQLKDLQDKQKVFNNFQNIKIENIPVYKNPFFDKNEHYVSKTNIYPENFIYSQMNKYKVKLHPNLIKNIESYSKEFSEYMRTTGAFYYPNIFLIYDQIVEDLMKESLEEELNYCIKGLDNFVSEIYKEEVFSLNEN